VEVDERTDPRLAERIGSAWTELRRGAAMGVLREHLFGSGPDALEPGQVDTLELLSKRRGWRMSDLAESLRVDPSTATRAVQRLEAAGLADRTPDTADKRVVVVSATAAGRARLRRIDDLRRATLPAMLASFDHDDLARFAEYLERFVAGLDQFVQGLEPDA
jgi:DNA-binding MarR family transcriptional regulator